jgi:hypothetical protein
VNAALPFVGFCEQVLGVVLTPAQRVLARVAFDGVEPGELEGDERELAARLFGAVDLVPREARAVLVAVCGARSGKSYLLGALYSLWRALTADLSTLAPGEQASALVVAPDLRLGRQVLRYALGAARSVPAIAELVEGVAADGFVLVRPDGARVAIEVLPATRGGSAVRGRSLVSAVLDELAFFRDESAVVNDQDLFRAVAPRVLPGGMVVLASTPWVEAGLLHAEFSANFGNPTRALAAHAPTALMRPDERTAGTIARERARDPDNAAREFDAEFMTGGAGLFFPPAVLSLALARDLPPRLSLTPGATAFVGGDLGLVRDASAFVAVHRIGRELVVADMLELRPRKGAPLKLSEVVVAACDFAARHGVRVLHVDHHALAPAREHLPSGFQLRPVDASQAAKVKRYEGTRAAMGEGRVRIPGALVRVTTQLADTIARPTTAGGISITQPRRGSVHGDVAAAFVLAIEAAAIRRSRMFAALSKGGRTGRAVLQAEAAERRASIDAAMRARGIQ